MRTTRQVTCECGQTFTRKNSQKIRCDGCQYRHELTLRRQYYQEHKDKFIASLRRWEKENPDKAAESSRISQRKAYRRIRKDPLKVKQMRKYHREHKHFFPDKFRIKDEVAIRDKNELLELGEIRAV